MEPTVFPIFTLDEVKEIRSKIEFLDFSDTSNIHSAQTSQECFKTVEAGEIAREAVLRFMGNSSLKRKLLPTQRVDNWLISRTSVGQGFKVHQDNPNMGHYSVSVFLNDDFEGGELQVRCGNSTKSYKPPAGHAVVYGTGSPHKVAAVTEGFRYVLVFWVSSLCKDYDTREAIGNLLEAYELLAETNPGVWENFEEAQQDPLFLLGCGLDTLIKKYSPGYI